VLIRIANLSDVLRRELVLPFFFLRVLSRIDEKNIIGLFAFLKHKNRNRSTGGVKQISWQADHGFDVASC
jgi:hypothetical protein